MKAVQGKRSTTQVDYEMGVKLTALRNYKGMSQEHLGELLNITFQQVQKYEAGKNRISASRLMQICEIFEVSPEFFAPKSLQDQPTTLQSLSSKELYALLLECASLDKGQLEGLKAFLKALKN